MIVLMLLRTTLKAIVEFAELILLLATHLKRKEFSLSKSY